MQIMLLSKKEKVVDTLDYKEAKKSYLFLKRTLDIFLAVFLILVLSPILILIFIIELFVTRGFPVFKDTRIGKNFEKFHAYKFRSMYSDSESQINKYLSKKQKKQWRKERKVDDDPRVTPFGKFLRKSSFDELPQLFNILNGTMTFIGPRPITEFELKKYFKPEEQKILLSTRPGLISYWGVMGRSDVSFEKGERQKLELDYFKLRSIPFDLTLFLRVIPVVVKAKGAR